MGVAFNYEQRGGMTPEMKAYIRENLEIGSIIPITKPNGKRGLVTKNFKVIAKYKHFFVVHNGKYKDTFLYIDLHSPQQEEEE